MSCLTIPIIIAPLSPELSKSCLLWNVWHVFLPPLNLFFYTIILIVGSFLQNPTLRLFSYTLSASPTNILYLCFTVRLDQQPIIGNRGLVTIMHNWNSGEESEVPLNVYFKIRTLCDFEFIVQVSALN